MRTSAQPRAATMTPPMRPAAPAGGPGRSAFDSGGRLPTSPARRGRKVIRAVVSFALVAAAAVGSMASYWVLVRSVLPGLRLREAAVVNLGSTAVVNTLPAGGALATGVSWAMLASRGISTADYLFYTLISGIWNVFARLGLPVLALLVLVTASRPGAP
jgi:hypothetical protein